MTGLRMRYFPKNRIGQGLLSMAPWLNVVLLIMCFMLLNAKTTLQNGVVINLPSVPFREGTGSELVAAVVSVPGSSGGREENIFFDDVRFRVRNEQEMKDLKQNMSKQLRGRSDLSLVIQADEEVAQGTIVKLMNIALEVGIKRVNIAAKSL